VRTRFLCQSVLLIGIYYYLGSTRLGGVPAFVPIEFHSGARQRRTDDTLPGGLGLVYSIAPRAMAAFNDNAAVIIDRAESGLLIKIAKLVLKSDEHSLALVQQVDVLLRIRPGGFVDGTLLDEAYGHHLDRSPPPAPMPALPPAPPTTGATVDVDARGGSSISPSVALPTEPKMSQELKRLVTGLLSRPELAPAQNETKAASSEVSLPDAGSVADQEKELRRLSKNHRSRQARAAKRAASSAGMAAGATAALSTSKAAAPRKRNVHIQCRQCRQWVEADGDGATCSCWDPAPGGDPPARRRRM